MSSTKKSIAICIAMVCATPAFAQTSKQKPAATTDSALSKLSSTADADGEGGDGNSRVKSVSQKLVGQPGPLATLTTIDGQRIALASIYGKKPVYLKFWATWCVPCREQMPGFEKIYEKYGNRIAVVAVNAGFSETETDIRSYRAKYGLHMPIVIDDGSLSAALNLRVTPQHVLIGIDGRIIHVGHLADKQLDEALEQAAAEKALAHTIPLTPQVTAARVFKVGDKAHGITPVTIQGKSISLDGGLTGKPHALMFFSPWCETYLRSSRPATATACRQVRLAAEKSVAKQDMEWIGISAPLWATEGELNNYATSYKTSMPLVLDKTNEIFGAFGIRRIPTVVLISANGIVEKFITPDKKNIVNAVQELTPQQRHVSAIASSR